MKKSIRAAASPTEAPSIAELRRTLPLGDDLGPTIDRLKALADKAGMTLLLAEGPPEPDWQLLELAGDALHHLLAAEKAYAARAPYLVDRGSTVAEMRSDSDLMEEFYDHHRRAAPMIVKARKLRATTPAGIYAKALLVRTSKTGAALLAMQLADELIACPGLRASLWPAAAVA